MTVEQPHDVWYYLLQVQANNPQTFDRIQAVYTMEDLVERERLANELLTLLWTVVQDESI